MKTNKVVSVEDYKIVSSFQSLRKTLLDDKFSDRLEKPLAYWAMPNDRRLPLAFLGRTIKDLLETPFEELSATPGIGQKKISCLVKLLSRATKDHPPAAPFGMTDLAESRLRAASADKPRRSNNAQFDPSVVSEAHWTEWRETVNRHDFGREKLGRLAPTLQTLPTVIWHTPLEFYLNYSVAEIRQLKTHGEKRVRVVLEVFHLIHQTVCALAACEHLSVRMMPKFIEPLERWIHNVIARAEVPSTDEVRASFSVPLLTQLRVDAGDTVFELSQGRLGITGPAESVRHQAKEMGVTRARVYQLLEDCAKIMNVRWPEGQYLLAAFSAKLNAVATPDDDLKLFRSTLDLFFPGNQSLIDADGDIHVEAAHAQAVVTGEEDLFPLAGRV